MVFRNPNKFHAQSLLTKSQTCNLHLDGLWDEKTGSARLKFYSKNYSNRHIFDTESIEELLPKLILTDTNVYLLTQLMFNSSCQYLITFYDACEDNK